MSDKNDCALVPLTGKGHPNALQPYDWNGEPPVPTVSGWYWVAVAFEEPKPMHWCHRKRYWFRVTDSGNPAALSPIELRNIRGSALCGRIAWTGGAIYQQPPTDEELLALSGPVKQIQVG